MKDNGKWKLGTGMTSILMIFVMLCLTTFAAISFVSAHAERKLSQKSADTAAAYYTADAKAQEVLASIDEQLGGLYEQAGRQDAAYASRIAEHAPFKTADGVPLEYGWDGNAASLGFTVPVDENRELSVRISLTAPSGTRYEIQTYQVILTRDWEDDDFSLWGGK